MPNKLPVPVTPKPIPVLDPSLQEGYSFLDERFEGEENFVSAALTKTYWQKRGWIVGIHEGKISRWAKGKHQDVAYFKIWFRHPKDDLLYTWWTPTRDSWSAAPVMEELTWFEFVKADDK